MRTKRTVHGHHIVGPRPTRWAYLYLTLYVCLPVLAIGLALDAAFYLIFRHVFGTCYALLCLL